MRITPRRVLPRAGERSSRTGVAHTADRPAVQRWPHRRLVVIRRDDELAAYDLSRRLAVSGLLAKLGLERRTRAVVLATRLLGRRRKLSPSRSGRKGAWHGQ